MLVLVTRPRPQGDSTARLLRRRGHSVMIDPVYDIVAVHPPPAAGPADAVILTSANAVPSLDEAMLRLPIFAVGDATARAAQRAGAVDLTSAGGDWQSLADTIKQSGRLRDGARILHLAGEEVRGDLAAGLGDAGFAYARCVVYRARARGRLAHRVAVALADRRIGAVLFFSPRAGRLWLDAIGKTCLCRELSHVRAVCISDATAASIATARFRETVVADQRDHRALADRLDDAERKW